MSHLPQYQTVPEMELIRTELGSACESGNDDGGMNNWLQLELARRREDGYDEGAPKATVALFAGLLIGSGSTALLIWFVTLVF
jgi:hypothetical protein